MAEGSNRFKQDSSSPMSTKRRVKGTTAGLLSWKSGKGFLSSKEAGAVQFVFPSPLDRIRSGIGRRERATQLGLSLSAQPESFEGNQSFPRIERLEIGTENSCTMDKFRGDELNTFSFSPGHVRGSFAQTPDSAASRTVSFNDSWTFYNNLLGQAPSPAVTASSSIYNPNKAVVTIDAKSSEILVANDMACRLFGYNSDELCRRRLADMFKHRSNRKAIVETHLDSSGEVIVVSGKVIDMIDSEGEVVPVSLWVKKLEMARRCLAVMEPVERTAANFTFDERGAILSCDNIMAVLHGYSCADEVVGLDIRTLIPSFALPSADTISKNVKKQQATGRTKDGATFPVSVTVDFVSDEASAASAASSVDYAGLVWVFANISGMITILPNGNIHSCNHYFALMLFGYTQSQLVGKNISALVPTFYDDVEFLEADSTPYNDDDVDVDEDIWQTYRTPEKDEDVSITKAFRKMLLSRDESCQHDLNGNDHRGGGEDDDVDDDDSKAAEEEEEEESRAFAAEAAATTTPEVRSIPEGSFFGLGRHRDGSDLSIIYQIKRVNLDDGDTLYCVWVSRDPEEPAEGGRGNNLTFASSVNSTLDASASSLSLGQVSFAILLLNIINEKAHSAAELDHSDVDYTSGSFAERYTTLQQIGKGAFGCVKMAFRNTDKLLVITKFIGKCKVYDECWVDDNLLKKTVPLEVSLLTTLKHSNIVQVLDVFENADYFQMVMEKHGCGMDLFEFIDRGPSLDEPLASLIFRQVASAVTYLHGLNILHRDIKDENIILNENFHIKLIDFGSATFMAPGKLFSTFCGTVEYCSPEVLQGNKYRGPELEMWSLGVTLYTLIFGENPFFDVDETIKADLRPPFQASKDLMHLIGGLLNADPKSRFGLRELETNVWLHQPIDADSYSFQNIISCSLDEANPPRYYYDLEIGDHHPFSASSQHQEFKLRDLSDEGEL
uniref:Protein kinase domain-containing protein n=1 Tax=Strigamia maritima TaxID=126957 RepID=T1JIH4_STRMM